jgi:hypothetical protein
MADHPETPAQVQDRRLYATHRPAKLERDLLGSLPLYDQLEQSLLGGGKPDLPAAGDGKHAGHKYLKAKPLIRICSMLSAMISSQTDNHAGRSDG